MAEDRRPVRFSEIFSSLLEGNIAFIVVGGVAAVLDLLRHTLSERQRREEG